MELPEVTAFYISYIDRNTLTSRINVKDKKVAYLQGYLARRYDAVPQYLALLFLFLTLFGLQGYWAPIG